MYSAHLTVFRFHRYRSHCWIVELQLSIDSFPRSSATIVTKTWNMKGTAVKLGHASLRWWWCYRGCWCCCCCWWWWVNDVKWFMYMEVMWWCHSWRDFYCLEEWYSTAYSVLLTVVYSEAALYLVYFMPKIATLDHYTIEFVNSTMWPVSMKLEYYQVCSEHTQIKLTINSNTLSHQLYKWSWSNPTEF